MGDKVKNKGKIYYTDPNNYTNLVNNEYGTDNVVFNQEDYSIDVDLQVIVPNRDDCGQVSYNTKIHNVTINNVGKYSSFLEGSKLHDKGNNKDHQMLTTSYTNVSYNEIGKGYNDKENLGIDSIDIDFTSWFYPRVTMKFIDVRGYSLMMPEEIAYAENLKKERNASGDSEYKIDTNKAYGSFFRALFSFPYPKFLLKVKGFYGNAVTFSLSVEDFKSSFDSASGNFVVTVNFIGYMYGFYTDIPMKYILVSPYDKYAGYDYWKKSNFKFDDGNTQIPTFLELIEKITKANEELEKKSANNINVRNYKDYSQQISALTEISNAYSNFIGSLGGGSENIIPGEKNILILGNSDDNGKKVAIFNKNLLKILIEKINNYNEKNWGKINIPNGDTNENVTYEVKHMYSFQEVNNKKSPLADYRIPSFSYYNELKEWRDRIDNDVILHDILVGYVDDNGNTIDGLETIPNNKLKEYAYLYKTDSFDKEIKNKIQELENKQKNLNESIISDMNQISEDILGFKPSIKNIFKIVFAHIDTFLNSMYACFTSIKNSNRLISNLGIDIKQTDINSNVNKSVFVPPFPLVTENSDEKKIAWVGDIPSTSGMEEISLINGIFSGIEECAEKLDIIQSNLSKNKEIEYIPINMTDIIMNHNPYRNIYQQSDSTIKIDELMTHFCLRAINYLSYQNKESKENNLFGQVDAYNYFLSHPLYDEKLISILNAPECNGESFLQYVKQEGKEILYNSENGVPIFDFNGTSKKLITDSKYEWIIDKDNIPLLPVNFENIIEIKNNVSNDFDSLNNEMFLSLNNNLNQNEDIKSKLFNNNIFSIYDDSSKFKEIRNKVKEQNFEFIIDKDKIFENWNIDLTQYHKYYDRNDTLSLKKKTNNEKVTKKSNAIPLDDNFDENTEIFQINNINSNKFFNDLKGRAEDIIKDYVNKKLTINDITLPSLEIGGKSSLYGNPFFYLQNRGEDEMLILYRKAILFLHSLPFSKNGFQEFMTNILAHKDRIGSISYGKIESLPQSMTLFVGALLWRERFCKAKGNDCFISGKYYSLPSGDTAYEYLLTNDSDFSLKIKKISDDNKPQYLKVSDYFSGGLKYYSNFKGSMESNIFTLRPEIKNVLINYFENWVKNSFLNLNNDLEFKLKTDDNQELNLNFENFNTFVDMWKMYDSNQNGYNSIRNSDKNNFNRLYKSIFNKDAYGTDLYKLTGFIKKHFNLNVRNNYQKISLSSELDSFNLMFRESSISNKILTQFFVNDCTLFIMRHNAVVDTIATKKRYDINTIINESALKENFNTFKSTLIKLYKVDEQKEVSANKTNKVDSEISSEIKLSAYLTLKNLYDRWLCSDKHDKWKLSNKNNEYENFIFIDSHYNNIGDELMLNCDTIYTLLKSIIDNESSKYSIYEFLTEIAQKNNLLFLALPIYNSFKNPNSIYELFTPLNVNDGKINEINESSTYVCMYTFEPSYMLNVGSEIGDYKYTNDGFDLADTLGEINEHCPSDMLLNDSEYIIPAFGVTYGKQNQNFFKRIDVSMDNPQVTEYSIGAVMNIANSNREGSKREITFAGQDLFKVYSNHSYTCTVEMMGCAPLMPMMYFQLNNIPLFKGAYMIISVKHHIEAGNMTTTFTGVRLNKNKLPMNKSVFNVGALKDKLNRIGVDSKFISDTSSNEVIVNDSDFKSFVSSIKGKYEIPPSIGENLDGDCEISYCYDEVSKMKDKNGKPLMLFSSADLANPKAAFDSLNSNMRKLIVDIAKTVDYNTDYKLLISSLKRNGSGKSDHNIGFAADLHGCEINDNCDVINKKKYSANLFDLIATTFTPYIRQLIWENKGDDYAIYMSDYVNNCVHLSSYGYGEQNDKTQIFQAMNGSSGWSSIPILDKENFYPLSKAFLTTCAELVSRGNIKLGNINNFVKSKMVSDEIKEKLLTFKINR